MVRGVTNGSTSGIGGLGGEDDQVKSFEKQLKEKVPGTSQQDLQKVAEFASTLSPIGQKALLEHIHEPSDLGKNLYQTYDAANNAMQKVDQEQFAQKFDQQELKLISQDQKQFEAALKKIGDEAKND